MVLQLGTSYSDHQVSGSPAFSAIQSALEASALDASVCRELCTILTRLGKDPSLTQVDLSPLAS